MLNKLTLQYFRRHESLSIDFTTGINVIRGANEAGKTTIHQAISYALFGAKALGQPIDEVVTWGIEPRKLKVTLVLTVGGVKHTFTRSKGSAEVTLNGSRTPFVTGQIEVSNFAASLLGADATSASKLLMASQNGIRGALEEGPKALSEMIEDLASFDTFDRILDAASKKLALGSATMIEAQLKGAESTLAAATASVPPRPDEDAHASAMRSLEAKASATEASLPGLKAAAEAALSAWQKGSAEFMRKCVMQGKIDELLRNLTSAQDQVGSLTREADRPIDTQQVESLKSQIVDAEGYAARVEAYTLFLSLPAGRTWKGTKDSFDTCRNICNSKISQLEAEAAQLRFDVKTYKAQRFDSTTCSKCGQTLPDIDNIVAVNAEVDKKLAECAALQTANSKNLDSERDDKTKFEEIDAYAKKLIPSYKKLIGYCMFDDDYYPMKLVWQGGTPCGKAPDLNGLRQALAVAQSEIKQIESARARLELAKEQFAKAAAAYNEAETELRMFSCPDEEGVLKLTADKDWALGAIQDAQDAIASCKREIENATREFQTAKNMWASAQARVDDANRVIESCRSDLKVLGFNNALVSKIRKIRPVIANKLWNTVLASVSVMFSQIRKEESWVVKDGSGFKVNGQAVESLSGSTLDILGLAIRCALLRTFIPQCGLLVLDEPMHGCDTERSEAMLGFLKSAGFKQTLLVSHEEVSESVADNLIQL